MTPDRAVGPAFLTTLLLALGCDDPAPNRPAPSLVQDVASSQAASASAPPSAPTSAPPAAESAPAGSSSSPAPAAAPPPSAAPSASGAASAPPPPRRKGSARTGILTTAESDAILPAGSPARVALLDAGGEPRSPARYAFTPGAKTGLEMGISMTLEVVQGERAMPPQKIPRITTLLDFASASAPVKDALGISATVTKVSIADDTGLSKQIAERLLPLLKTVEGLSLRYDVTPGGRVERAGAKTAASQQGNAAVDGTIAQMTQSVESMIVAFPDEAIGVGARWEVVSRVDSSGTDLLQWSTYQLEERDERGVKLALEVVQAAAKPEMTPPGAPAGFSARVVEFASTGKGETLLDFASPAPRRATASVESKMALQVAQPGAAASTMSMKSTVIVETKRSGAAKAGDKKPAGAKTTTPPPAPTSATP